MRDQLVRIDLFQILRYRLRTQDYQPDRTLQSPCPTHLHDLGAQLLPILHARNEPRRKLRMSRVSLHNEPHDPLDRTPITSSAPTRSTTNHKPHALVAGRNLRVPHRCCCERVQAHLDQPRVLLVRDRLRELADMRLVQRRTML